MKDGITNFDQFFYFSKDMMSYIRPDGTFERVNPAWSLQFGWTQDELISAPIQDFLHPDDRSRISEALIRASEGHAAISFENRFRCKDATYKWISWNAYFLSDQNCVFALTYDITERNQAAEMLRVIREDYEERLQQQNIELKQMHHHLSLSEKRFHLLEQNVQHFAVIVLDVEGRVMQWSPGAERVLGYTAKEIIGEYFSRFYRAEDIWHGKHHHALRTVLAAGRFEDKGFRLRKDGTFFYAYVTLIPFYNETGTHCGYIKLICDRTDQNELKGALHASGKRYHTVPHEDSVGYYVSAPDGCILSCNSTFARMFGFMSIADAQQSNISQLFESSTCMEKIYQPLYEHKNIQQAALKLRHKTKDAVSVLASALGKFDERGGLMEIHGCFIETIPTNELEQHLNKGQNIESSTYTDSMAI